MSARTGAIVTRGLSLRDRREIAARPKAQLSPEMLHPDCREVQIIFRTGEVIVWLIDDTGRRFASLRSESPRGILGLPKLQTMSVEMIP